MTEELDSKPKEKKGKDKPGISTLIVSTGGRRFLFMLFISLICLKAVANTWITSTSFENIITWLGLAFITGNTIEMLKPQAGGVFDKLAGAIATSKSPKVKTDNAEKID